jgi:hypothetical protein
MHARGRAGVDSQNLGETCALVPLDEAAWIEPGIEFFETLLPRHCHYLLVKAFQKMA